MRRGILSYDKYVTCIHQVPMHIASHAGVNVEKNHCAGHASDILLYASISKDILGYDVSYNLTLHQHASCSDLLSVQAQAGYESIC